MFSTLPSPLVYAILGAVFSGKVAAQDISVIYSLDEELPAGTFVGDVAHDSNIRDFVGSEEEFRALTYSFLAEGSNVASNFRLQGDSGMLSTGQSLDREALCKFRPDCQLPLRVAAQSTQGLFFRIIDVSVVLNDVNDNAPSFQPSLTQLTILENAAVGDLFQLPTAIDADTGANHSVQNYSLLTSGVPFGLKMENGVAGSGAGLWLKLTGPLDRETVDSYTLLLVATDGGSPVHTGTLTVNIEVGDVNDHIPIWDQDHYATNVSEIVAVDSIILIVAAHDLDIGDNGAVVYRFTPLQADTALGLFALNQTSGEISVAKPLDSHAGQTFTLEVEARDLGTPFKSTRTDVIIHVMDTHNSKPEIILSVFGQGNVAILSELSELGRVVAHIAVKDRDSGLNGIVSCAAYSSHFDLQAMDVKQYKVILTRPLDRETQDWHDVNVTCQDAGSPPLFDSQSFRVKVADENDNIPVFSPDLYEVGINESADGSGAHDVFVTTVTATDNDIGENARLSFRVINDVREEFRVLDNGTLLAVAGLDRETELNRETGSSPRRLLILAHDHGTIENSATATVLLTVHDINDNYPAFHTLHPLFYVSEGIPVTSFVGNVSASDEDAEENGMVSFQEQQETSGGLFPFEVLPNGIVRTRDVLDRETVDKYEFPIIAYDHGHPPLSSTVTATIVVTDINDNSPIFLYPTPFNNTLHLPHTLPSHTLVTSLQAYDLDAGINGDLLYSRDGLNASRFFDVIPTTGDVILIHSLTEEDIGEHILTVAVHDQGAPLQLANQTLLYINVYKGNQSEMAMSKDEETLRNTLLVIIIVTVTVLLTIIVGVTMLMMKRKDRHKRLYRAKEAECKVDSHLRQMGGQPWSHELHVSTVTPDLSLASSDQRRRKEVSFSLDEDNHMASGSAAMTLDTVAADSLEAIPEMSHSQKRLLGPRAHDDDVSDVSTTDSGRGGSDVEMHSQHGVSKESGDNSFASNRGPSRGSDSRRHQVSFHRNSTFDPNPQPYPSIRLTTFPTSHVNDDLHGSQRQPMTSFSSFSPPGASAHVSPSPSSFSSIPSGRPLSKVHPRQRLDGERDRTSRPSSVMSPKVLPRSSPRPLSLSASPPIHPAPPSPRPPPSSSFRVVSLSGSPPVNPAQSSTGPFSSSSPRAVSQPAQSSSGQLSSSPGVTNQSSPPVHTGPASSGPLYFSSPRVVSLVSPSQCSSPRGDNFVDLQHHRQGPPNGARPSPSSLGGSYVQLKVEDDAQGHGDYMHMGGSTTYVPASPLSNATSGTCDGETTLSGSYTVDPQELVQEIDQLFFDTPGDVVV